MVRTLSADVVDTDPAGLGEGPTWDAVNQRLLWVDVFAGRVHAAGADGVRRRTWEIGRHVSAALPTSGADLLLTAREGFVRLDADGTVTPLLDVLGDNTDVRFNDAKCDPAGRALAGTMAYDSTLGAGALYRLDPGPIGTGPSVSVLLDSRTVSNGMAWNAAGDRFYYIDTTDQRIATFAYGGASLGEPLSVIDVDGAEGSPDGMCIDHDGALWVALWDGGQVRRYTPDGRIDTVIPMPVSRPTSCAFGGSDGGTLFITSASRGLPEPEQYAGCVFALRPGVTGPPATPWQPL
jgi:sugar lactone lactonase YvrE